MKFTDKNYYIDKKLVEKLDLMVERVVKYKFDNLIIIDGKEGFGKSNLASSIAYYLAWKSGREFSIKNLFFLIDDMIDFAVKTEKQVIWWDESALGGLSTESYSRMQIKLLKLLYVARKKQHFYIFVIPKYFSLRQVIVDRAVALIHTYSRDEVTRGRFAYYKSNKLEAMYEHWKKTRDKGYKKYYSFLGTFPETLPIILDEKEYDKLKDSAILTIGGSGDGESRQFKQVKDKLLKLQIAYSTIPLPQKELCKHAGIGLTTLKEWKSKNKSNGDIAKTETVGPPIQINEVTSSLDGDGEND